MGIIYNDSEPKPAFPINIAKMNPHPGYARHCENYYYLKFIFDHPEETTGPKGNGHSIPEDGLLV
jgi:hypothetical protein